MSEYRKKRNEAFNSFIEHSRNLRQIIGQKEDGCEYSMPVGYDQFIKAGHNIMAKVCDLNNERISVFNVMMHEGSEIAKHSHRKETETIYVIEGSIIDLVNGVTTTEGHVYRISPGQLHHIKSDFAMITITFKPPFK